VCMRCRGATPACPGMGGSRGRDCRVVRRRRYPRSRTGARLRRCRGRGRRTHRGRDRAHARRPGVGPSR
jgi:hypothetical protein